MIRGQAFLRPDEEDPREAARLSRRRGFSVIVSSISRRESGQETRRPAGERTGREGRRSKEMVKAMRVGLEPIRKVEIGALEDVLCIRFPEKSGVWVKSSGGMPFVRPEKSLHSFCVLRGDEGEGAKPRKHRLLCLASDGRAPDKSSIKEVRDEMSEDGWLRAIRRFSSDGSEASASSLKCFVEFIPVTLDVIRVETPRGYLVVAATDAPLTRDAADEAASRAFNASGAEVFVLIDAPHEDEDAGKVSVDSFYAMLEAGLSDAARAESV